MKPWIWIVIGVVVVAIIITVVVLINRSSSNSDSNGRPIGSTGPGSTLDDGMMMGGGGTGGGTVLTNCSLDTCRSKCAPQLLVPFVGLQRYNDCVRSCTMAPC